MNKRTRTIKPFFVRPPATTKVRENELVKQMNNLELTPRPTTVVDSFELMGLKQLLKQRVYAGGYEKPAHIQQRAIIPGIDGRDIIMQAQSGMGKTLAMAIIVLQRIKLDNRNCQAVILAPTRELAIQIGEVFTQLGSLMQAKIMISIGGKGNLRRQMAKIHNEGVHILVATLGRLEHMLFKYSPDAIDTSAIQMFVMDEADKMLLDSSFKVDLKKVIEGINPDAQVILMSATMPEEALKLANQIARNPAIFTLRNDELTLEGIKQYYVEVGDEDTVKLFTLCDILARTINKHHTLIFCRTRARVNALCQKLLAAEHRVTSVEGVYEQERREAILNGFRRSAVQTLISSDLLGRGIDVQQVSLVINYDYPNKIEDYIHRVGRGGRHGRKGIAITFVKSTEMENFQKLQLFYNTKIETMPRPDELFRTQ